MIKNFIEKVDGFFGIAKSGSNVRTEVMAGLATFLTMAYITVVNPAISTNIRTIYLCMSSKIKFWLT